MIMDILGSVFTIASLLAMVLGLFAGIIIGALPGLGATMGVALLLPITFSMDVTAAMMLLVGCYCGAIYGGSISAILIGAPGTAASAATVADGYAMAKRGFAKRALSLSLTASVLGALISGIGLLVGAPVISAAALKFSSPEFLLLALGGLILVAGIEGSSFVRGLISASIGLLITTMGIDSISGTARFTFDQVSLMSGIDFIPVIIGLFALAEVFRQVSAPKLVGTTARTLTAKEPERPREDRISRGLYAKTAGRSGLIGYVIGVIPGLGPTVSAYMAYSRAKAVSKKPEAFGQGSEEGVVSAEAANNGTTGATLVPLLTLGIPGDAVTAVLLGAFLVQGLTPGPLLITDEPVLVYSIIVGFIVINILMYFMGRTLLPLFSRVSRIPNMILMPIVVLLCVLGTYALNNSYFDVLVMAAFGVIGFVITKVGLPVTPMLIGVVLGEMIESEFRRSLIMSDGSFDIFFTRPISLALIVVLTAFIGFKIWSALRKKRSSKKSSGVSETPAEEPAGSTESARRKR